VTFVGNIHRKIGSAVLH